MLIISSFLTEFNLTVNNQTNLVNGTTCHFLLFNPNLSVESHPNYEYSICPDTLLAPLSTSVILFTSLVLTVVGAFGIFIKRKSGHVRARSSSMMLSTLCASVAFVFISTIRIFVGRKIFPCALFSLTWFLTQPLFSLPTLLRSLRLFFMYRLNLIKTMMNRSSTLSTTMRTTTTITSVTCQVTQDTPNQSFVSPRMNPLVEDATTTPTPSSTQSSTPLNSMDPSLHELENTISPLPPPSSSPELKFVPNEEISTLNKRQRERIRILHFFTSHKFTILVYSTCILSAIGLWLLLGSIEEGIYRNSPTTRPNNENRIIVPEGGLFLFTHGCISRTNSVILMISQAAVYMIAEIVVLILGALSDRDTWRFKMETFVLVIFQVILLIVFSLTQINIYVTLLEFIFPSGAIISSYSLVDVLVSVILPLCYAIREDYKKSSSSLEPSSHSEQDSQKVTPLELILHNKKMCSHLLDFARKSYCPENILCYNDIERYETTNDVESRRKLAFHILDHYLNENSPLELNLPKKDKMVQQFKTHLDTNDILEKTLFVDLKKHCINDMQDIYERYKEKHPNHLQELHPGSNRKLWKLDVSLPLGTMKCVAKT